MTAAGKITGVSLGPGDPWLITVKGLQTLREADKIYYPGSLLANGETGSYALSILQAYELDESRLKGMFLLMSDDRSAAETSYHRTFLEMQEDYRNGLKVAFVSEGDISFYSTFAYLLEHFQNAELPVEIIAGVPSFLLGASARQIPLAILNEKIAIIPRLAQADQLLRYLDEFETVVLIKVRSVLGQLAEVLRTHNLQLTYCERLGTVQQFITTDYTVMAAREIPYFSLLILKKI